MVRIRRAVPGDLEAIVAIELRHATTAHWTWRHYEQLLAPDSKRLALVAELDQQIAGFLVARRVADEYDIEYIAVLPELQRQGLGGALLGHFVDIAIQENVCEIFLEVRESNTAARALYRKWCFSEAGRRKGYYTDPVEDAIVYCWAGQGGGGRH